MKATPRNRGSSSAVTFDRPNIYLLKASVADGSEALKDSAKQQFKRRASNFESPPNEIYYKEARAELPTWVQAFSELSDEVKIDPGYSPISLSGILFLRASSRLFAITFGYGRHGIKSDAIEHDFGFESVNRLVEEDSIDSVEYFSLENNSVKSSKQAALGAKIGRYGVNADNENVRGMSGLSKHKRFGERLSGSTPFNVNHRIDLVSLQAMCKDLLAIYSDPKLKGAWNNRMAPVREKHQLEALDAELLHMLVAKDLDQVSMGLPDGGMLSEAGLARLETEDGVELGPLFDLPAYITKMRASTKITRNTLSAIRIYERPITGGAIIEKATFWECLEATATLTGESFYLINGRWYKLDSNYLLSLNNFLEALPQFKMPPAFTNDVEGKYNKRAAEKMGAFFMDKDLARGPGFSSGLELCDILTKAAEFVHVKWGTRSSTMSHLLNQGFQSAYQSRMYPPFKKAALALMAKAGVPANVRERYENNEIEVVFAIITDKKGSISKVLPYMAKVSLQQKIIDLQKMGIPVKVSLISVVPPVRIRPAPGVVLGESARPTV